LSWQPSSSSSQLESAVLEHADAAYNLARWLVRSDQDAQDVVQDACVKALRSLETYRGGDFRAWFLTIVRNASFTWLRRNRPHQGAGGDDGPDPASLAAADSNVYDPAAIALRAADADLVRRAIDILPEVLREAIVLREMEGLSYKEIGRIAGVPIGTVMSRLARGRKQLQALLTADMNAEEGARDDLRR